MRPLVALLTISAALVHPVLGDDAPSSKPATPTEEQPVRPRLQMTFDKMLQRFDANKDGEVTKQEYDGPLQVFYRLDENGDGKVIRDEFESVVAKRPGVLNPNFRNPRATGRGVREGDTVPSGEVFTLDGKPVQLSTLWADKPLVLVAGSITCPVAVDTCPSLKPLQDDFDPRVNVAVLYVREAHPQEQQASGRGILGKPDVDASGIVTGLGAYSQPQTFEQRLELAHLFDRQQGKHVRILVTGMDNRLVSRLGTGPNSGLLIDRSGKLILKQQWYSSKGMRDAVANLLNGKPAPKSSSDETP